jgi:hypothetical protein
VALRGKAERGDGGQWGGERQDDLQGHCTHASFSYIKNTSATFGFSTGFFCLTFSKKGSGLPPFVLLTFFDLEDAPRKSEQGRGQGRSQARRS